MRAVKGKTDRIGYISFLTRITPDCDCVPWSDASIVPDIGILASKDPVAIDAAACDLVNQQQGFAESLLAGTASGRGQVYRDAAEHGRAPAAALCRRVWLGYTRLRADPALIILTSQGWKYFFRLKDPSFLFAGISFQYPAKL